MGCCGDKRAQWASRRAFSSVTSAPSNRVQSTVPDMHNAPPVAFEYVGETALNVEGPITRIRYRFPHAGARLEVDQRDAAYLGGVPKLRRVPKI